jgi:hypothetical protein
MGGSSELTAGSPVNLPKPSIFVTAGAFLANVPTRAWRRARFDSAPAREAAADNPVAGPSDPKVRCPPVETGHEPPRVLVADSWDLEAQRTGGHGIRASMSSLVLRQRRVRSVSVCNACLLPFSFLSADAFHRRRGEVVEPTKSITSSTRGVSTRGSASQFAENRRRRAGNRPLLEPHRATTRPRCTLV